MLVTAPYENKGYIDAKVAATPTFHSDRHLVDYSIQVTPGEPYQMGELTIHQLDDARKAQVLAYWPMKPGGPFDHGYAPGFLRKHAAHLHALDGYSASYRQIKHLDTHLLDLEITFKKDKLLRAD